MNALASVDLGRLAKICGLFSSDHMGERAGAAAQADKIVRAAGLTWPDVLCRETKASAAPESLRRRPPITAGEILARHGDGLSGWERGFLTSLIRRRGKWSERQTEIFREICDRVAGAGR